MYNDKQVVASNAVSKTEEIATGIVLNPDWVNALMFMPSALWHWRRS